MSWILAWKMYNVLYFIIWKTGFLFFSIWAFFRLHKKSNHTRKRPNETDRKRWQTTKKKRDSINEMKSASKVRKQKQTAANWNWKRYACAPLHQPNLTGAFHGNPHVLHFFFAFYHVCVAWLSNLSNIKDRERAREILKEASERQPHKIGSCKAGKWKSQLETWG